MRIAMEIILKNSFLYCIFENKIKAQFRNTSKCIILHFIVQRQLLFYRPVDYYFTIISFSALMRLIVETAVLCRFTSLLRPLSNGTCWVFFISYLFRPVDVAVAYDFIS